MAITGTVEQTNDGKVFYCSLADQCMKSQYDGSLPQNKNCLLSVYHGDRCQSWSIEHSKWLIDQDINNIKQL